MFIFRQYINAVSIVATIFLGCLCLHIKVTYGTFITEDVHQILPYLLISLGLARIFLFCIFNFAENSYRHVKEAEMARNIHASAIVTLIMVQLYLGVSELMNYEQIHDGVWMATFHTGYEDHKPPWDELMKNFNCCGVYGSDKWDRFEFPCLEPGIMKVGCPGPLITHIVRITYFIAISLLLISAFQLYHVMEIKKRRTNPTKIDEERRKLMYL